MRGRPPRRQTSRSAEPPGGEPGVLQAPQLASLLRLRWPLNGGINPRRTTPYDAGCCLAKGPCHGHPRRGARGRPLEAQVRPGKGSSPGSGPASQRHAHAASHSLRGLRARPQCPSGAPLSDPAARLRGLAHDGDRPLEDAADPQTRSQGTRDPNLRGPGFAGGCSNVHPRSPRRRPGGPLDHSSNRLGEGGSEAARRGQRRAG
jgi:hypothetical protein